MILQLHTSYYKAPFLSDVISYNVLIACWIARSLTGNISGRYNSKINIISVVYVPTPLISVSRLKISSSESFSQLCPNRFSSIKY